MSKFNPTFCYNCHSFCEKGEREFHLISYTNGCKITIPTDRNYLLFIISGSVLVNDSSTKIGIFNTHEFLLLPKQDSYSLTAESDCELITFGFTHPARVCDNINLDLVKEMSKSHTYKFKSLRMRNPMLNFIHSLIRFVHDDIGCKLLNEAKKSELFIILRFYYSPAELFNFFYPVLSPDIYFKSLVMSNWAIAKNVNELADLTGFTVHAFKRMFTRYYSEPPYQWMSRQKSAMIKARLLDKNIPIKVIVDDFGFSSQSHLNTFCKRYLGGTPKEIRNSI